MMKKLDRAAGIILILVAIGLAMWKCQFGLDLTDEVFYLAPAWKMFSLGDRPLVDEIYNGPRQSDLLNYLFVQPFVPFSVLWARIAAVGLYAIALLFFLFTVFRSRFGLLAGLVFYVSLVFDVFNMPTWSYNWWVRNLFLAHHGFFWLALSRAGGKSSGILMSAAGICTGMMCVAHNAMAAFFVFAIAVLILLRKQEGVGRAWLPYLVAGLFPIALDAAYLLSPGVRTAWFNSLTEYVHLQRFEQANLSIGKILHLVETLMQSPEFWGSAFLVFLSRYRPKGRILPTVVLAGVGAYLVYRFVQMPTVVTVPGTYHRLVLAFLGLALGGAGVLTVSAFVQKEVSWLLLGILGIAGSFLMGLASVNRALSMVWIIPPLLGIVFAHLISNPGFKRISAYAMGGLLLYTAALSTRFLLNNTYYDVAPAESTHTVEVPPFQGIKTSPRRGYLVEQIAHAMEGRKFAMAYVFIPAVFAFSEVRSALDTLMVAHKSSPEILDGFLRRMAERKRYPEVILETKYSPWAWGMPDRNLYFQSPIEYGPDNPFVKFRKCVSDGAILSFPEFDLYAVNRDKVAPCLLKLS